MSPIFTDKAPAARGFRRVYGLTAGALGALCVLFLALTWSQGPKLEDAVVDSRQVTERADQQLRLFINQQIAGVDAGNVTITPRVPVSVSVSGGQITVQFEERLDSDTEYLVEIDGVTSPYHHQPETIRHTFTTAAAEAWYVDRAEPGESATDSIVRANLASGGLDTVYSATGIDGFAHGDHLLAVHTVSDGTSGISLVNLVDDVVESIALPDAGTVNDLQFADTFLTFRFTEVGAETPVLMRIDLSGVHDAVPVPAGDGSALRVLEVRPLPSSSEVLVLTSQNSLLRVDLTDPTQTTELGAYDSVGTVSADGTRVIVGSRSSAVGLSLLDGSVTPLHPSASGEATPIAEDAWPLSRAEAVIGRAPSSTGFDSLVLSDPGDLESRVLYTGSESEVLTGFSVSPNDQFFAVEVHPTAARPESDDTDSRGPESSGTTRVYSIGTGALVRELRGVDIIWE